jgi:ABC-type antimicrobial peptide transport system permease subunit
MEEHMQISVFLPRLAGLLLFLFGALALLLAVVGLYSVIAFNVVHRTREIGVRIALGATGGEILRLVLRQGLVLTAIGVAIGLGLGAAAGRALEGQLVGVSGADPVSFGLTAVVLGAVALAACVVPARRAARLDPLVALRRD